MSGRRSPMEELERLLRRMNRQFDDESYRWESQGPLIPWVAETSGMAIDVVERDDEFVVTVDLPGFERDDIDIRVTYRTLQIEAERGKTDEDEPERFLRRERRRKSVERSIRIPGEIDKSGVTARIENGVLTVRLPKVDGETARKIEVDGE